MKTFSFLLLSLVARTVAESTATLPTTLTEPFLSTAGTRSTSSHVSTASTGSEGTATSTPPTTPATPPTASSTIAEELSTSTTTREARTKPSITTTSAPVPTPQLRTESTTPAGPPDGDGDSGMTDMQLTLVVFAAVIIGVLLCLLALMLICLLLQRKRKAEIERHRFASLDGANVQSMRSADDDCSDVIVHPYRSVSNLDDQDEESKIIYSEKRDRTRTPTPVKTRTASPAFGALRKLMMPVRLSSAEKLDRDSSSLTDSRHKKGSPGKDSDKRSPEKTKKNRPIAIEGLRQIKDRQKRKTSPSPKPSPSPSIDTSMPIGVWPSAVLKGRSPKAKSPDIATVDTEPMQSALKPPSSTMKDMERKSIEQFPTPTGQRTPPPAGSAQGSARDTAPMQGVHVTPQRGMKSPPVLHLFPEVDGAEPRRPDHRTGATPKSSDKFTKSHVHQSGPLAGAPHHRNDESVITDPKTPSQFIAVKFASVPKSPLLPVSIIPLPKFATADSRPLKYSDKVVHPNEDLRSKTRSPDDITGTAMTSTTSTSITSSSVISSIVPKHAPQIPKVLLEADHGSNHTSLKIPTIFLGANAKTTPQSGVTSPMMASKQSTLSSTSPKSKDGKSPKDQ